MPASLKWHSAKTDCKSAEAKEKYWLRYKVEGLKYYRQVVKCEAHPPLLSNIQ